MLEENKKIEAIINLGCAIAIVIFFVNVLAIWFTDGIRSDDQKRHQAELCGQLTDPSVARGFTIAEMEKCSNVAHITINLRLDEK